MKIIAVEPILYFHWLVVRVRTDAGITGVGQTAYWGWRWLRSPANRQGLRALQMKHWPVL